MQAKDFAIFNNKRCAYLDNAATSLLPEQVIAKINEFERGYRSNVARGIYPWAEQATQAYEDARSIVAKALNADPSEIIFTSGTTASLNLAANFVSQFIDDSKHVLVTELEHHSNIVPWQLNFGEQKRLCWSKCTDDGKLDYSDLSSKLNQEKIGAVTCTHASNVTGEIVDISLVSLAAKKVNALLVVDGAQYIPHQFTNPRELGADFYAFSGHKCNGPMGIGVLWAKAELLERLKPMTGGGGMVVDVDDQQTSFVDSPHRFEAGTPSIPAAIGLGAALELRLNDGAKLWQDLQKQIASFDQIIVSILEARSDCKLFGASYGQKRIPITSFNLDNCHAHDVCQILAEQSIFVRGGHHCTQPLMRRLGINACVRISLGPHVIKEDIENIDVALDKVVSQLS